MAFSLELAGRIRDELARVRGVAERKMFGGVAFLLEGNLLVAVWQNAMIVRLGPGAAEPALRRPYVRPFDLTGKPMKNWVIVEAEGLEDDASLRGWVDEARRFVETLPPK